MILPGIEPMPSGPLENTVLTKPMRRLFEMKVFKYMKIDLALNNLQRLICHQTKQNKINITRYLDLSFQLIALVVFITAYSVSFCYFQFSLSVLIINVTYFLISISILTLNKVFHFFLVLFSTNNPKLLTWFE